MPNVFKIPDTIEPKYHGCGIALASITGGTIIDLVYLRDVLEDFDDDLTSTPSALADDRLGPTIRLMQSTGEMFVGMCSCHEFVVL